MDKLVESNRVSEDKNVDTGSRPEAAKLVEMGSVSVETKGYTRGLELGFTPRA